MGQVLNQRPLQLIVCPMVLRVCKKCTAKEIPTLDPRATLQLHQPCHCKTMQNCTPTSRRDDVQNSSKQLLSFHHFSSGLCPSQFKAKTKSSILYFGEERKKIAKKIFLQTLFNIRRLHQLVRCEGTYIRKRNYKKVQKAFLTETTYTFSPHSA